MYQNILQSAMKNAEDKAVFVEGDRYEPYFKDMPDLKVIVCGKCGKKKEVILCIYRRDGTRRFPLGKPVKVACLCDCEADSIRKSERARADSILIKQKKMDCWGYEGTDGAIRRNTGLEQTTLSSYKTEDNIYIKTVKRYLNTLSERIQEGKGLFLCGSPGSGKTYASVCLANALMDRLFDVRFINFWEVSTMDRYSNNYKTKLDEWSSIPFLFIDDFDLKKLDKNTDARIFPLLDTRIKRGVPTIITSNSPKEKLYEPCSEETKQITDRIIQSCYIIEGDSHNYRRENE